MDRASNRTDAAATGGSGPDRLTCGLEAIGLLAALGCVLAFVLGAYSLIVFSDPMEWYRFGRDFGERFATTRLAYGFPLLMHVAIAWVGPFRAYLVNVPVLVLLAGLLYAFARQQARPVHAVAAPVGAAVALVLLLHVDARLLLALANPYRDALSYVLLLLSAVLTVASRRSAGAGRALAAGAGAALALACSTRETSALLAGPILLYVLATRLREGRPLLVPGLAFAAAFAVAILPLLIQNQLAGGAALVPGQAAEAFDEEGLLAPGVRPSQLAETLPLVVADLRGRYDVWLPFLGVLGVAGAVWRRRWVVLALTLPAFVLYVLFYGAYVRRVTRYLFVADLFALALAAAGAAWLVDLFLAQWRRPRWPGRAALVLAFALVAVVAWQRAAEPRTRLRLSDVERFVTAFEGAAPPEATVVGMRPITDLLRGFTDHPLEIARNYWDLHARLTVLFDRGEHVLVARGDTAEDIVRGGFDLVDRRSFDPSDYGLQRHFGAEPIRVSRVVPWTLKRSRTRVPVGKAGDYALALDVGRLSLAPRNLTMVLWGDETVGRQPADGLNYFHVSVPEDVPGRWVSLVSDGAVPSLLKAELSPLRHALRLSFVGDELLRHMGRFSWSFLLQPRLGFPSIASTGYLDVPTLRPERTAFVVTAEAGLVPDGRTAERSVAVEAGGHRVGEWTLSVDGERGRAPAWRDLSFALYEPMTGDPRTRLYWTLGGQAGEAPLGVRSLEVRRVYLREQLRLELASPAATPYLVEGFKRLEPRQGRWLTRRAELRLLSLPSDEAGLIEVVYAPPVTITERPPRPRFRLDGQDLPARFKRDARSRAIATVLVPAGALSRVERRLEIEIPDADGKPTSMLLESVRLRPVDFSRLERLN
jgi:hypothetical protein